MFFDAIIFQQWRRGENQKKEGRTDEEAQVSNLEKALFTHYLQLDLFLQQLPVQSPTQEVVPRLPRLTTI